MHESASGSDGNDRSNLSRRSVLKASGAGLAATGLAGCLGSVTGGGAETIRIGVATPTSGPYGHVGTNEKQAVELAIEHAREEGDAGDREIEMEFGDTKTDPSQGRKVVQEQINNDADFIVGGLSSATALSISGLCAREDVVFQGIGGSNALTGSECKPTTFITTNSATMQASSGFGGAVRQGAGESVFELTADYAWGQSIQKYNKGTLAPSLDVEYLGNIYLPLGTKDFSSALTKASDSGADILNFNFFGSDNVSIHKQGHEFGLIEDHTITTPANGLGQAEQMPWDLLTNENYFAGVTWYWDMNETSRNVFADPFNEAYGTRPFAFSAGTYVGTRTTLKTINEIGSTDTDDLISALEGREMFPQFWEAGERYRACDHRGTTASLTVRGRTDLDSMPSDQRLFETVYKPDNPEKELMRTCENTGCDGPFG